jgi:hypothetical protein
MKSYILILLSVLFIQHCEPYIVFDNPQPLNQKNQNEFNKKLLGIYINEDSVELYIKNELIIKQSNEYFEILQEEFDTMPNYRIEGNYIFGPEIDSAKIIEINNDTIFGEYIYRDTIFSIDQNGLLRKHKNNYFLNIQHKDHTWEVINLVFSDNKLKIRTIDKEKELEYLQQNYQVDSILNDSSIKIEKYIIQVNKKEFLDYFSKGFKEVETWIKKE